MSMVLQNRTNLPGDEPIQFSQLTSLEELQELNNSLVTDEQKKSSLVSIIFSIKDVEIAQVEEILGRFDVLFYVEFSPVSMLYNLCKMPLVTK